MKQYSSREVQRFLMDAGFQNVRTKGGHQIWSDGKRQVAVTVAHMNACVANRILKEYCMR